jgi:cell division protein FtsL
MVAQSMLRAERKYAFRQQFLWVLFLWMTVLISALGVIYAAYDTRNKFSELEVLRMQQDELQVEWGKYLLEESAWASYGRIEKVATEKLLMQVPVMQQIIMVNLND